MKKWLLLGAVLCTHPLCALLSPLSQSIVEIEAIAHSPELSARLPQQQSISEISKTESGYIVRTSQLEMGVSVVYESQTKPGPQKFRLVFQVPTEKGAKKR